MSQQKMPEFRRVVTGHNAAGRAIIKQDDRFQTEPTVPDVADFSLIWTAPNLPVDNNDEIDGRARDAGLTIQQGSVIRIVDMLPGGVSAMHRTNSLDYGIIMSGQVELEVDDGAKTVLGQGDIIVQRGTMHLWRNPSDSETCRIIFVLTQAEAYRHDGQPMEELHP